MRLASPITAGTVGLVAGAAQKYDTNHQIWYCAGKEYTTYVDIAALGIGAATYLATDIDADVSYGMMIAGAFLGASRVGLKVARDRDKWNTSSGAGCTSAAAGGAPLARAALASGGCGCGGGGAPRVGARHSRDNDEDPQEWRQGWPGAPMARRGTL